jgi:hypothetical protein
VLLRGSGRTIGRLYHYRSQIGYLSSRRHNPWPLGPSTGQDELAAAEGEGIGRAQARLQGIALGVREWTHVQGRLHASWLHIIQWEIALAPTLFGDKVRQHGVSRKTSQRVERPSCEEAVTRAKIGLVGKRR